MIPASWQRYIHTREAAAALGYFGAEPDPVALQEYVAGLQQMAERLI